MIEKDVSPKSPVSPAFFSYKRPPDWSAHAPRHNARLMSEGALRVSVILLRPGAGNRLHTHEGLDTIRYGLKGRVRFFRPDGAPYGDLTPGEGVLMPPGVPYRFECVGDEDAEFLEVCIFDPVKGHRRIGFDEEQEKAG